MWEDGTGGSMGEWVEWGDACGSFTPGALVREGLGVVIDDLGTSTSGVRVTNTRGLDASVDGEAVEAATSTTACNRRMGVGELAH